MAPRTNRGSSAVAEPPTDFNPDEPIDPATVMAGDPIGDAVEDLKSPAEVRATVKALTEQRTVDPTVKYEKPPEPTLGNNAKVRLIRACGSAAELRQLQQEAEAEQRRVSAEIADLERERDAEVAAVNRKYDERIAAAQETGRGAMDRVNVMRSARDQVIGSVEKIDWLKKQRVARQRAIANTWHEGTTVLENRVQQMRKFVNPPQIGETHVDHRSWPRVSSAFALHASQTYSRGHMFLPPGVDRPSVDEVMRHLQSLHATWSAQLPALERELADNQAAKQRDLDLAEDELIGIAVESM